MAKQNKRYKDTVISPGSQFYQRMEELEAAKDQETRKNLTTWLKVEYKRLDDEFHRHFPRDVWNRIKGIT